MNLFKVKKSSKSDTPKWVRYLGLAGKIAVGLSLLVLAVFVIFALRTEGETVEIPGCLSFPIVFIPCITLLILLASAVGECVLMCKAMGMKALRPVFISFLVFYIIFLIYNFFSNPSNIQYLNWLIISLIVSVGSCALNFWRRK